MGKTVVYAPIPPMSPEEQRRIDLLLEDVRFKAKVVVMDKPPPPLTPEEYRRAAAPFRRCTPIPVVYTPRTVVNLSAHTCATRGEYGIYYDLANAPEDSGVFMILDPATGVADDEFKASMIKRYRVAASSGIADGGASLLKHNCEEPSESTETVVADLSSPTPGTAADEVPPQALPQGSGLVK